MSECSISLISTKRGPSCASWLRKFPSSPTQNSLWRRTEMTTSLAQCWSKQAIEQWLTPCSYYTITGFRDTSYRRGWWGSSTTPRLFRWWPPVLVRQPWSPTRTSAACSTMNKYLAKWGTWRTKGELPPTTQKSKQLNRDLNQSWQNKIQQQYKMASLRSSPQQCLAHPQLAKQLLLNKTMTTSSKSLEFLHRIENPNYFLFIRLEIVSMPYFKFKSSKL